MSIYVTVIEFV